MDTPSSHDRGDQLVIDHHVGSHPQCRLHPLVTANTPGLGMHRSDRITQRQPAECPVGEKSHPGAVSEGQSPDPSDRRLLSY